MRTPDKWDEFEKAMWAPTVSDETRHYARVTHGDLRRMNFPEPEFVCVDDGRVLASWQVGRATLWLRVEGSDVSWSWNDDD